MPGSHHWSLSLRFPHQNLVYTSPLPHKCYMFRLSHSSRFHHPRNIRWAVEIKFLITWFSPPRPSYAQIFSSTHCSQHPQPTFPEKLTSSLNLIRNSVKLWSCTALLEWNLSSVKGKCLRF
jgi:hypothetical protein